MTPVRFRDCACPGTPHPNGDTVTFKPRLSFDENVAALSAIFSGDGVGNANKAWGVYLRHGVVAWNLLDDEGKPVPLTSEALEALPFEDQFEIGDRGDDVYAAVVLAPLRRRTNSSSESGPTTDGSPRPTKRSSRPRAR
jgi:hypothetical protein